MRGLRRRLLPFAWGVIVGAVAVWMFLLGPVVLPGTATVIDGDSVKIAGYNVRLAGLYAPELPIIDGRQCRKHNLANGCYNASSTALANLITGETVVCLMVAFDWRNRRPVVICKFNGIEINKWLIQNCLAGSPKNPTHRIPGYEAMISKRPCPNV